jgi:FKBP-type peptidyl-prolyl cis-trans isomerase (trigger factor)
MGAFSVARRSKNAAQNLDTQPIRIEGERLKPIRRVMRDIERPDGVILRVKVPVYPPFKLKDRRKTKS